MGMHVPADTVREIGFMLPNAADVVVPIDLELVDDEPVDESASQELEAAE